MAGVTFDVQIAEERLSIMVNLGHILLLVLAFSLKQMFEKPVAVGDIALWSLWQ